MSEKPACQTTAHPPVSPPPAAASTYALLAASVSSTGVPTPAITFPLASRPALVIRSRSPKTPALAVKNWRFPLFKAPSLAPAMTALRFSMVASWLL